MAASLKYRPGEKRQGFWMALPAIVWLGVFFLFPLAMIFVVSFLSRGSGGIPAQLPFTFKAYQDVFGTVYFPVVLDSIWIAFLTTVICLVLGYPLAFFISTRKNAFVRQFTLFLVILPFWTNFLVRTYAWIGILGNTDKGTINGVLMQLGIIQQPLELLFTPGAVLVGLVYGFLPFMVLPIYASVERFDFHFVEAAHDLGANDFWAFWRVVFPMTLPGVVAGCILVFIPTIGAFVTPDLMGGTQGLMIGNLITGQFRGSAANWPRGAAFSMVMMAMVLISLFVYIRFGDREG
jgi:spermidine/putrescine transport system permease protein